MKNEAMEKTDFATIEHLLDTTEYLSVPLFNKFLRRYLDRKSDADAAVKELDNKILALQSQLLTLSMHLKQNFILNANRESTTDFYYTKQEIAVRFRVSVRTVSNWVADGLETVMIGGVKRISEKSISAFTKEKNTKKFNWRSIA